MNPNCSIPTSRPQPATAHYPVSPTLENLTAVGGRAGYLTLTGEQAPDCRKDLPLKVHFRSDIAEAIANGTMDPNALVQETVLGQMPDGTPFFATVTMTASEAANVNLPGLRTYPAYQIAATLAQVGTSGQMYDPADLSTAAQGALMLAELNPLYNGKLELVDASEPPPNSVWNGETRRRWELVCHDPDVCLVVGRMMVLENAEGIGAPGHWTVADPSEQAVWNYDKPFDGSGKSDCRSLPLRAQLPNESGPTFGASVFDPPIMTRTDLIPPGAPAATSGGGLTGAQDAEVSRIEAKLDRLLKQFGTP
jgi:hypothetical protein